MNRGKEGGVEGTQEGGVGGGGGGGVRGGGSMVWGQPHLCLLFSDIAPR